MLLLISSHFLHTGEWKGSADAGLVHATEGLMAGKGDRFVAGADVRVYV